MLVSDVESFDVYKNVYASTTIDALDLIEFPKRTPPT